MIIDEVSMVRADLLDAIESTLRNYRNPAKPFGGVQVIMFGDLGQLPPVVSDEGSKFHFADIYPSLFFLTHLRFDMPRQQ